MTHIEEFITFYEGSGLTNMRPDDARAELGRLRDVAAAAWGYRVAYEGYWGAGVPDSELSPETKKRLLAALVGWQQELDKALDALDDNPGDFATAKAEHRATIDGMVINAELLRKARRV